MVSISTAALAPRADLLLDTSRNRIDTVATGATSSSWRDLVANIERSIVRSPSSTTGTRQIAQLADLLKLQVDVSRYQLRVEMFSKVAESALASMRKLQQNQ